MKAQPAASPPCDSSSARDAGSRSAKSVSSARVCKEAPAACCQPGRLRPPSHCDRGAAAASSLSCPPRTPSMRRDVPGPQTPAQAPPMRKGSWARLALVAGRGASGAPRRTVTTATHTVSGGPTGSAVVSGLGPPCKRCCNLASTNSRQPTGLPRTTTPRFSAGSVQLPVQQGLAASSGGNMSSSPGGSSPALFQARVFPRCTWMLACCRRESWRIRNWSAVRSGCPVT